MAKVDVLNTSVIKSIVKLSVPAILSNLSQTLYNIVDAYFLGKLGKVQFSAPTITWPYTFIFIAFAAGFGIAGTSLVAQYTGANNKKQILRSAGQTISVTVILSIIFVSIGWILMPWVMNSLAHNPEIAKYAMNYLKIIFLGLPFMFLFNTISGIYRGWGEAVYPMVLTFLSITMNTVLDPLLIFGYLGFPKLGVTGAALATTISRITISIISLFSILKGWKGLKLNLKCFVPRFQMVKKIISVGFPQSLGMAITASGFTFIMGIVAKFGPAFISIYGIGNRIVSVSTMLTFGIATAVTTMVGQFLGAKMVNRAIETVWKASLINFLFTLSYSAFLFFFGKEVTRFFINDLEVIELGKIYFRLISFSLPFFTTYSIFMAAFRGAGKTLINLFADTVRLWGVRIPVIKFLAEAQGIAGIMYGMIISNVIAFLIGLIFILSNYWKKGVIEDIEDNKVKAKLLNK